MSEFDDLHYCDFCGASFDPAGTTRKTCSEDCREQLKQVRLNGTDAKFVILKRALEKDRIYERDDRLIHSPRFYEGLINGAGNQCQMCEGPLGGGHSIDRANNKIGHRSTNIGFILCGQCNKTRSRDYSVEEFPLLRPGLIAIRELREAQKSKRKK